jgi:hypothetical protein
LINIIGKAADTQRKKRSAEMHYCIPGAATL